MNEQFEKDLQLEEDLQFKKDLQDEIEAIEIGNRPYEMAERAFYERQAKEDLKKNNKKKPPMRILAYCSAAVVLLFGLVFGGIYLFKGDATSSFNFDTPFEAIPLTDIKESTNLNVKLPYDFDNSFVLEKVNVYYPKQNEPCAIFLKYEKTVGDDTQTIDVLIMVDSDYEYTKNSSYDKCIDKIEYNGISVNYKEDTSDNTSTIISAKYEVNGFRYYYDSVAVELSVLETFVNSLR